MTQPAPPLWTGDAIARACDGTLSAPFVADGVTFDSREVIGGELFFALRGETADGHAYVASALQRGAAGAVVEQPVEAPHVLVQDGMAALQALARAARGRTTARIIGVTGSAGKTGTKEALRQALARIAPKATHASVKSYNNHTGVPLSLARMPAESRFGIFEMGMNHAGELAALTRMVRPHVACVTTVANAHRAHFAQEADIAHAKAEIFEGVEPDGFGIWPVDNPHADILHAKVRACGLNSLGFGTDAHADVRLLSSTADPEGTDLTADVAGEIVQCRVSQPGQHMVMNALAVLAGVKAVGGDLAEAGLALAELPGLPGRGARMQVPASGGTALLIDESYNANPASMAAALAVLGDTPAKRRLAVLGAMRELGDLSDAMHAGLKAPIADAGIAGIALVGPEMAALAVDGATYLPDADAALGWAKAMLRDGDVLMVKGSNSLGLARLVQALKDGS